jgi:hypothetical protein
MLQLLVALTLSAHAETSISAALSQARALPKPVRAPMSAYAAAAGRPAYGTVSGGFSAAPVELAFDRRQWTIKGGAVGRAVDLKIDHEARTITGGLGGQLSLTFVWTPEYWVVTGDGATMQVHWKKGTVIGAAFGHAIDARFDLREGWIKGGMIDLQLDAPTGRLTGGAFGGQVDATLTNLDLSDLLMHLYVFCAPQRPSR